MANKNFISKNQGNFVPKQTNNKLPYNPNDPKEVKGAAWIAVIAIVAISAIKELVKGNK